LVKITDTPWSAGAGNLALTNFLQAVLAERQPVNVTAYLKVVQPLAQKALGAHAELFKKLEGQPGQAGFNVMSGAGTSRPTLANWVGLLRRVGRGGAARRRALSTSASTLPKADKYMSYLAY
jgi:hypothetical protein